MDLERMSVRLRPRNAWEALDLGFALVRQNARQVYSTWCVVYLPVAALLVACFRERPIYAWLLLWWLKPLFDRVVLEVLSAEIFEVRVTARALVARLPGLLWRSGIVGALAWRRFDFARSLHLPVYQLERLSGRDARARVRVLDRDGRGAAVGMMAIMFIVELSFALALSLAAAVLVDVQTPIGTVLEAWWEGTFTGAKASLYGVALGVVSMSAVEPLYVACGFTLYLQRRTALEGWDIELRFRQLATRIEAAKRSAPALAAGVAAFVLGLLLIAPSPGVHAADSKAKEEMRKVLADPEFGHEGTRRTPVYVGPTWSPKSPDMKVSKFSWLLELQQLIANASRAIAWAVAICALVLVLYYAARYARLRGFWAPRAEKPKFLFGLDVRPESLPDDVPGTAAALIGAGRTREALSLLYRGALVRFMEGGIEFLQGDTEGDCMRRVMNSSGAFRKDYFSRLVAAWQQLAYGHREVPAETARSLAGDWSRAFEPAPAPSATLAPKPA